ncbi:MAG: fused MFS/spermidine synthase [Candidatus Omnitrophota bacterium]|nr:MAG: fused MFS/spermidine synthase [Candidatus Omnitrophota bacterium]
MNKRVTFAMLLMGFTSLVVQTLLIREFLITFYGTELIIGIILANWIILEAIGSNSSSRFSLKAKRPILVYALLQLGIALYFPVAIYLARTTTSILGLSAGEGVGFFAVFLSSLFIIAPLSIFDGAQFPFGCRIFSKVSKQPLEAPGKVYILEAMGFIIAGPIFTYVFLTTLDAFQIAIAVGILNLLSGLLLLGSELKGVIRNFLRFAFILLLVFLTWSLFNFYAQLKQSSIRTQWHNQKVLDYHNSIYGNLVVIQSQNQYTFYSDGIPIIASPVPDITFVEELTHFTLLTHKDPREVLVLSGGAGGLLSENFKHPLRRIDYTELDPALIKLIKKFPTELTEKELKDPRLNIKHIDGRRFVRLTKNSYDAIILNLPMPSTLQLNRFYTQEFFKDINLILKEEGIFSFVLPGSLSYINDEMRNLNGSILNTLKSVFGYVKIIPGDVNIYLASKNDFTLKPQTLIQRLKERKIKTHLLLAEHIKYKLLARWQSWFKDSMGDLSEIRKNHDLKPSGVFYSIAYWNALFSPSLNRIMGLLDKLSFKWLFMILCFMGAGFLFLQKVYPQRLRRVSIGFAIASTGFVGMSFDLILILAYQSFYGFIFHHLALLVTAFMAGLALGGWRMTKRLAKIEKETHSFFKIELAIILFCLLAGPFLIYLNKFDYNLSFMFFLISGVSGFLVGSEFPLANKIYLGKDFSYSQAAGRLYALDLAGAWGAALLIAVVFVPVIGIIKTCLLLATLKIFSSILIKRLAQ